MGIRNKHLRKFNIFDIKELYPFISENLFKKALTYAKHTHFFQMMTKQLLTTQENHYPLTMSKLGSGKTVSI